MPEFLFTYGTLQPGHAPEAIASAAAQLRLIGEGHIRGTLYDFGRYPGAIVEPNCEREIYGTVYELPGDPEVLQRLDEYEECVPEAPDLSQYLRNLHPVELANGQMLTCWVYIYNRDLRGARIVESGRWLPRPDKQD